MSMLSFAPAALFAFCMIFAALSDLTSMRIPNRCVLLLLGGFALAAPLAGMGWQTFFANHLPIAAITLAVGFVMFAAGWVGAGDVKLMSATALWLGFPDSLNYLLLASVMGGAFALMLLAARRLALPDSLAQVNWINRLHSPKSGLPYGIALGPVGLYAFSQSPWMAYAAENIPIG